MSKFIIEPNFRLQEWVAREKGYFDAEGLDYEFRELIRSTDGQHHAKANQGAFQSIEKGREANVSCACHWTVNVAASKRPPPRRTCRHPDFSRLPVGQPLLDHPGT